MSLPSPHYTFTIPSLHDNLDLDCRIYHPRALLLHSHASSRSASSGRSGQGDGRPWRKRVAIVAHPYAPLGGSYDDHVVGILVGELLKEGFVVETFNFRGAYGGKGRTSWTGKAEMGDYISVIGLLVHYASALRPEILTSNIEDTASTTQSHDNTTVSLILGGYSYGSMIASHAPSVPELLRALFDSASTQPDTAASEIILRAQHLASAWNEEAVEVQHIRSQHHESSLSAHAHAIAMGGIEGNESERKKRVSRESRRSFDLDGIRKSLDRGKRRLSSRHGHGQSEDEAERHEVPSDKVNAVAKELPEVRTSYLLVSPLLGPISTLATFFSPLTTLHFESGQKTISLQASDPDFKLAEHSTLVAFGEHDGFTSGKKLTKWASALAEMEDSKFSFESVGDAGHFWNDGESMRALKGAVREWLRKDNCTV